MNTLSALVLLAASAVPARAFAQSTEQTLPPIVATAQPSRPPGLVAVGFDVEGPRLVLSLPRSDGGYRSVCVLPCTTLMAPGPFVFAMHGPGIDWSGDAEVPPSGGRIHVRRAATAGIVGGIGLMALGGVLMPCSALVILLGVLSAVSTPDANAIVTTGVVALAVSAGILAAGIVLHARSTPRTRVEATTAMAPSEHGALDPASAGVSLVRATVARF